MRSKLIESKSNPLVENRSLSYGSEEENSASSELPLLTMQDVCLGEEPPVLCVDDQAITLIAIIGTFKRLGEVCIGKLNGSDAIEHVR